MLEGSDSAMAGDAGWNLILEICRHGGLAGSESRLAELNRADFRVSVLDLARRHAVLGLILVSVERSGAFRELAPAVREELLSAVKLARRRSALWLLERDRILSQLAQSDLDPVVLKGAALCTTVYREPAERQFIDLDLLVEREDVDTAVDILAAAGYRFERSTEAKEDYLDHHFHYPLSGPRGSLVEVHWGLTRPGRAFHLDAAAFVRGSVISHGRDSVPLRMPRPEHLLLHVVDQNIQESFARLSRLVDVDRIVRSWPDLSWTFVRSEASEGGMQHALWLSLRLAGRLLRTPVPLDVLESIRPPPLIRLHLGLLQPEDSLRRQSFGRRWAASKVLELCLQTRRGSRFRLLWGVMSGSPDPMLWVWVGEARRARHRKPLAGLKALAKLMGFQVLLYLGALIGVLTRARAGDGRWYAGSVP